MKVKALKRNNGRMTAMKKLKVEIIQEPPVTPTINTTESQVKTLTHREKYPNGKLKVQYAYLVRPDRTQVKNGYDMLVYQAANSGEIWNG